MRAPLLWFRGCTQVLLSPRAWWAGQPCPDIAQAWPATRHAASADAHRAWGIAQAGRSDLLSPGWRAPAALLRPCQPLAQGRAGQRLAGTPWQPRGARRQTGGRGRSSPGVALRPGCRAASCWQGGVRCPRRRPPAPPGPPGTRSVQHAVGQRLQSWSLCQRGGARLQGAPSCPALALDQVQAVRTEAQARAANRAPDKLQTTRLGRSTRAAPRASGSRSTGGHMLGPAAGCAPAPDRPRSTLQNRHHSTQSPAWPAADTPSVRLHVAGCWLPRSPRWHPARCVAPWPRVQQAGTWLSR